MYKNKKVVDIYTKSGMIFKRQCSVPAPAYLPGYDGRCGRRQMGGRKMVKVGIIGATGYAGGELVRILVNHPDAEIVWYGSRSYIDKRYYEVYQNMFL